MYVTGEIHLSMVHRSAMHTGLMGMACSVGSPSYDVLEGRLFSQSSQTSMCLRTSTEAPSMSRDAAISCKRSPTFNFWHFGDQCLKSVSQVTCWGFLIVHDSMATRPAFSAMNDVLLPRNLVPQVSFKKPLLLIEISTLLNDHTVLSRSQAH